MIEPTPTMSEIVRTSVELLEIAEREAVLFGAQWALASSVCLIWTIGLYVDTASVPSAIGCVVWFGGLCFAIHGTATHYRRWRRWRGARGPR